jgi:LacI family transcriptional regulator
VAQKRTDNVTIIQVAERAGVSTATAGRVLGGYGYSSDPVRERVQAAAAALGYRPNHLARGLITGKTQTIGVVAGDISSDFYASAMRGIADVARAEGVGAILTNSDENLDREREAVQLLLEKRVDGLIVSPCDLVESRHLRAAVLSHCPVVQIDRIAQGLPADSITVDNRGAARTCVARLLAVGHTRIAFVAELESSQYGDVAQFAEAALQPGFDPQKLYPSWQRLLGYLQAHRDAGVAVDLNAVIRVGAYSVDAARSAVLELFSSDSADWPTALFASDGMMSTGAMAAISARGLSIPHELSLVCFDDLDWMSFVGSGITTVVQPVHQMGTMAADFLLARIAGDTSEYRHVVLPAQFAERGSIAPPRTPDRGGATDDRSTSVAGKVR